jgi:hypothetical protein
MRVWYKLIAASLVLMALLAPSISLAVCAPDVASSDGMMHCPPDCPMMAAMQHRNQILAPVNGQSAPSCCTIRSSNPAPVKQASIVAPATAVEAPRVIETFYASAVAQAVDRTDPSPPPLSGSQAILCTFLI